MRMRYILIIMGCMFLLGVCTTQVYNLSTQESCVENVSYEKKLDGLWLPDRLKIEVDSITKERDSYGDWVCVNVKGMSYERGVEVCKHEIFHEIFSECGEVEDPEKCFNKFLDYRYYGEYMDENK